MPANSPAPIAAGTAIIPPAITALSGDGAAGLSLQQTYTVTMLSRKKSRPGHEFPETAIGQFKSTNLSAGKTLIALPPMSGQDHAELSGTFSIRDQRPRKRNHRFCRHG